jgi:integrase
MTRAKRGFAQVTRQRSGRFAVRYTTPAGARISAGKTFRTKADAEAWAADKRREIARGIKTAARPLTFGAYAPAWLDNRHVGGRPIKPRTRDHYARILEAHLLPAFGSRPLAAITPADVRDWHAATLVDHPTMRAHTYSLLRTILGSARADDLIGDNPCRIVGAGTARRAVKIELATAEELVALAAAMPERLRLMVFLASWCALRFGETVELRRGDVDLGAEVIRIRRAAVRVRGAYQVSTPKSDASVRDVAIPPHIVGALEDHLARHVGAGRDALLFPAGNGRHLQPSTLYRHWRKAREQVGRPELRWHDLRHSGGTLAAQSGATLAELMGRLGHSTPAAALRYQHVGKGRDREIAALLSKLAGGNG